MFFPHKHAKIKISSDEDLPLEKALNLYNVVIPIKSVLNINTNIIVAKRFQENVQTNNK